MSITTRVNQLEARLALKNGDGKLVIAIKHEGESDDQAIQRVELTEYPKDRILVATEIDERI